MLATAASHEVKGDSRWRVCYCSLKKTLKMKKSKIVRERVPFCCELQRMNLFLALIVFVRDHTVRIY